MVPREPRSLVQNAALKSLDLAAKRKRNGNNSSVPHFLASPSGQPEQRAITLLEGRGVKG